MHTVEYQAVFTVLDLGCLQAMYGHSDDIKVENNFMHRKCNSSPVKTVAVLNWWKSLY